MLDGRTEVKVSVGKIQNCFCLCFVCSKFYILLLQIYFIFLKFARLMGSSCTTPVECMPRNREALGSNCGESWALFSPLSSQQCLLNSGPSRSCRAA